VQTHGGEGLDLRVRGDPLLAAIAAKLAAHHFLKESMGRMARNSRSFSACIRLSLVPAGASIAKQRDDLQQVVLNHVAHRADLLVERAAALHAEGLRHGDLDVLRMYWRFQIGSRKALAKRKYKRFCTASLPR
jgi:hypothetical protein